MSGDDANPPSAASEAGVVAPNGGARHYAWGFAQQLVDFITNFGISVVIARILGSGESGLMAMIVVFTGFAAMFLDLGFGQALIQNQSLSKRLLSSVFWLNLFVGALLSGTMFALAPSIARFYHRPELVGLARITCFNFVLASGSLVDVAMLRRKLEFKTLALVGTAASIAAGLIGVALAAKGFGARALAGQAVSRAFIMLVLLRSVSSFSPSLEFDQKGIRALSRYSLPLTASGILNYWTRNLDNLLVGRSLGSAELGVYSKAYGLFMLPLATISRVVASVLFPSLMKKHGDVVAQREEFLKACRLNAAINFPVIVGLATSSTALVATTFGPGWAGMAPIIRAFAVLGLYQSIVTLYAPVYLATGSTMLDLKVSIFVEPAQILCIACGIHWGVMGVIASLYVAVVLNFYLTNVPVLRLLGIRPRDMATNLLPPLAAAVAMGVVVVGVAELARGLPAAATLILQVATGVVAYVGFAKLARLRAFDELTQIALRLAKRKAAM